MWNLKLKNNTNELIHKTETDRLKNKLCLPGERNRLGLWDRHVHTALLKADNQQGPTE